MINARKLASDISHKVREELAGKNVAFDVEWPNPEEMSLSLSIEGQDIVEREIRKALDREIARRSIEMHVVEPSDAERATWPEATENYVAALERLVERPRELLLVAGQVAGPLEDIAAERRRQVEKEGWTPEHDDRHNVGEMALAAACYALTPSARRIPLDHGDYIRRRLWPWDLEWWKPTKRRRDLVKAGALIVAEIERLDRQKRPGTAAEPSDGRS